MSAGILDRVWDGAGEAWQWLRGVVMGEWEDNRSISQIVTDAMVGFVPGFGSAVTLRDLLAIIVRLAKYPEKRSQVDEWILLVVMLLPLVITLISAAGAGVGALVGAELGGFLRATGLFLVKEGGVALKTMVEFFQAHGYGHVVNALKDVKFAKYKDILIRGLNEQINKLVELVKGFEARLRSLSPQSLPQWMPGRDAAIRGIAHCQGFIRQLEALRRAALDMIPKALIEMDRRLGALLAGDVKAATQVTHSVATGREAPAVSHAKPDPGLPGHGRNENPEPGNTRRVREKRLVQFHVQKSQQEYRFVNSKGIPVGGKPFHQGETVVENPQLKRKDWDKVSSAVREGYPDLAALDHRGHPTTKYDTFSDLSKVDLKPGDKIVRIVPHDGQAFVDTGGFWTRTLSEDGRQMRSGTAVKEVWNKDGSYVELTVPPKGHLVWRELGQDPSNPVLKGWEGTTSSQVYEFVDPKTGNRMIDGAYLAGGDKQLYMDPKQMEALKRHGFISERKPTNFKDYDPNVINTDGTKGNIVPRGDLIFENIPSDQAILRAKHSP